MEQKKKASKRRSGPSFLRRALTFILAMLLGQVLLVGAVVGSLYAGVTWVSLNRLESFGVQVGEGVLQKDSVLREMSLLDLVGEATSIAAELDTMTVNTLVEKYGLVLSDEMRDLLPGALLDIPLAELTGANALDVILENTTFGDVLPLVGSGVLPAPLEDKLVSHPLSLLMQADFGTLLAGVYLGDLVGITVRENALGEPEFVIPEGEEAALMTYLATLDLGEYLGAEDGSAVLQDTLDTVPLDVLLDEGDNFLVNSLRDKKLGDLLKMEEGGFYFDTDAMLDGMYLGTALGYEKNGEGVWLKDGAAAKGIEAQLVDIALTEIGEVDILGRLDAVYVAELMEYEKEEKPDGTVRFYKEDEDGNEVEPEGITKTFLLMTVEELRNEGTLKEELLGLKVGTVMEYTEVDGIWYESYVDEENNTKATGAMRPLLGKTVEELDGALDTLYLGEILGFDKIEEEGEPLRFAKDNGEVPDSLMANFVGMTISQLDDPGAFSEKVQGVLIGDAMGYTLKEDGKWYEDKEGMTPVKGVLSALAGSTVAGVDDSVKTLKVSDALGYEKNAAGKWMKGSEEATPVLAVIMDSTLDNLSSSVDGVFFGELMGYEKYDKWTTDSTEDDRPYSSETPDARIGFRRNVAAVGETPSYEYPKGAIASFVGLTVANLKNENAITDKIEEMKIGVAMGYEETGDGWKDGDGNAVSEENHLLLSIIGVPVKNIGTKMHSLRLCDVLGYEYTPKNSSLQEGDEGYWDGGTWQKKGGGDIDGFMKLLHPETPIDSIETEVARIEKKATIQEFMDAGVLVIDDSEGGTQDMLDVAFEDDPATSDKNESWRYMTLNKFVQSILDFRFTP